MRLLLPVCVLAAVVVLSACSFFREFAVVNESNERIQVRYVQTKPNHPEYPSELIEKPKVKLVSELGDSDIDWRLLPETRFTFSPETRTVVLTLEPKEAVRVAVVSNAGCVEKEPRRGGFYIEEINVIGPSGAIRATGEQARSSFVEDKNGKCLLTYR
jgi:hypothetical protein